MVIAMKLAVRTAKVDVVKPHSLSSLELVADDIIAAPTKNSAIRLLNLNESDLSTSNSIRNIETLFLDKAATTELQQPTIASEVQTSQSLDCVDELGQYEYLCQLLMYRKL